MTNVDQYENNFSNNMNQLQRPADNLVNNYMRQEGIDRRYSQLITQELLDATEMTNDQLNRAAGELQVLNPNEKPVIPKSNYYYR